MFAERKGAQGAPLAARSWLSTRQPRHWLSCLQDIPGGLGGQLSRFAILGPLSLSSVSPESP